MTISVLYLGATGYIGGSVLVYLIKEHPNVNFKALVRSDADVGPVEATGAIAIKDSLKDYKALSEQVSQADIVINTADCDDVGLADSILKGLKNRFENGKAAGALVHTSGVANFLDWGKDGRFDPNARVWTDAEEEIKQITPEFLHGKVDVPILKAGEEGYVTTFIVAPSGVFGRGLGPVKKISPYILHDFIKHGYAYYIGEGSNLFSSIHVEDLAEVYNLAFKQALEARNVPLTSTPYSRYYFVESEAVTWKRIANAYSKALFERGKVPKPKATSITFEQGGPYAFVKACSMYVKSVQMRSLGWEPKFKITDDVLIGGVDDELSRLKA